MRQQYRIQRAERLPAIGANATLERSGGDAPISETYSASLGLASFAVQAGAAVVLAVATINLWLVLRAQPRIFMSGPRSMGR